MKKLTIGILGATSHIAKGLIHHFLDDDGYRLHLYTRFADRLRPFLATIGPAVESRCEVHEGYAAFQDHSYDAIVNCVGIGTLNKFQGDYSKYFTVIEEFDNLAIFYLRHKNPSTLYISMSSGAVYGGDFSAPVTCDSENRIRVNRLAKEDFYGIVRLNAEAKHRAFEGLNVVDLRVFSYFSRFFDPEDRYFMTDVIDCVLHRKVLTTGAVDFVRDYVHPADLFSLVACCLAAGRINEAFDVTSAAPVTKREILDHFVQRHGLEYVVDRSLVQPVASGTKHVYYSTCADAARIGYRPRYRSIDAIIEESEHVLAARSRRRDKSDS